MTTTAILAVVAAAVVCVLLVPWARSRKSSPADMPLTVPGLCSGPIGYNRSRMDRTSAAEICNELLSVKHIMWPELIRIYETGVEYPINTIILDPAWVDPKHTAGIKCVPGPWTVTMNPLTRWGYSLQYDFRNAFGAELHSVIRLQLYGRDNHATPINDEDRDRMRVASRLWKEL